MSDKGALLIVDDNDSNRRTLAALLELEDYVVETADGLGTAEAALEKRAYVAVLVDVNLGAQDGLALVPAVRRLQSGAQLIAMSGDVLSAEREALVDGFFLKGTSVDELVAALEARAAGAA